MKWYRITALAALIIGFCLGLLIWSGLLAVAVIWFWIFILAGFLVLLAGTFRDRRRERSRE